MFINKVINRLTLCEDAFNELTSFIRDCLFSDVFVAESLKKQVKECVYNSWETPGDIESNNLILEVDKKWANDHHLDFHPSITINDFTYRGDIEFADIREAICAAYQERPQHCNLEKIWEKEASLRPYAEDEKKAT